jgi:hypothetical protein
MRPSSGGILNDVVNNKLPWRSCISLSVHILPCHDSIHDWQGNFSQKCQHVDTFEGEI